MKKGIDIDLEDNTVKSIENAIKYYKDHLNKEDLMSLKINSINLEWDLDNGCYFLQIRFE